MKTIQSAMQVRVLALSLGIMLFGLVVSGTAGATSIQFSFTGIVQGFNVKVSPPFDIGQPMSGFFTVDLPLAASTDSNLSSNIARYSDRISSLSVTIGTSPTPYVATFGQLNNDIRIRNLPAFDSGELVVNTLTSGAPVNGLTPKKFNITLVDGTAGAFNSQYPTTVPSLSSFLTTNQWRLDFTPGGRVQGMLTSLTVVPLPAAVLLFGVGLISLVGLGAGGLRNLRGPQA
jgi:hypothetical protein